MTSFTGTPNGLGKWNAIVFAFGVSVKYKIYANEELIGESELERGDSPMGVAFGAMEPTENYWQYQAIIRKQDFDTIEKLNLQVRTEQDFALEPCVGVGIEDLSEEADETLIEIAIVGLERALYEKYFVHHTVTYEAQFK
ncbi:MAG: hypothetical protein F6J87_10075 [Spirulina sp. SIO3F2]|nr:hypothetical protein [Spirulina sp. SIO3F2]